MRAMLLAVMLTCAFVAQPIVTRAQASAGSLRKLYAVVFEVTVTPDGKIATLKVSKVIDPTSRSTDAVAVDVPGAYIDAVRAFLNDRTYPTSPSPFYTYAYYDPSQPTRADIDPKAGAPPP